MVKKSMKAADLGKMQFCAQQAPGGAILVPERLGAALLWEADGVFHIDVHQTIFC